MLFIYFSGGADDFDEVEDDADLDELDQPEVTTNFSLKILNLDDDFNLKMFALTYSNKKNLFITT